MLIKKYNLSPNQIVGIFLPIGLIMNTAAILIGRFSGNIGWLSYIEGLLMGIAVPFLLIGLYYSGKIIRNQRNLQENEVKNN